MFLSRYAFGCDLSSCFQVSLTFFSSLFCSSISASIAFSLHSIGSSSFIDTFSNAFVRSTFIISVLPSPTSFAMLSIASASSLGSLKNIGLDLDNLGLDNLAQPLSNSRGCF